MNKPIINYTVSGNRIRFNFMLTTTTNDSTHRPAGLVEYENSKLTNAKA